MTDKWIKEAFRKAGEPVERGAHIAEVINDFLERETPHIMDLWAGYVGKESYLSFIEMLANHDELIGPIGELTKHFTIAGYLLARHENETHQE
jgi:hypothetical protein